MAIELFIFLPRSLLLGGILLSWRLQGTCYVMDVAFFSAGPTVLLESLARRKYHVGSESCAMAETRQLSQPPTGAIIKILVLSRSDTGCVICRAETRWTVSDSQPNHDKITLIRFS